MKGKLQLCDRTMHKCSEDFQICLATDNAYKFMRVGLCRLTTILRQMITSEVSGPFSLQGYAPQTPDCTVSEQAVFYWSA